VTGDRTAGGIRAAVRAARLEIQVPQPAITHTVTVQQLARWANGSAINPDERIRKDQLKAILSVPEK
jgi:hypothetical protein